MTEIWLRKYKQSGIQMVWKVKVFDSIDWKFASPVSPMPLPEESGQQNILIKMEGNTHSVNLTWLVKNESTNQGVSNTSIGGGYTGDSKSIFEVLKWMSDETGGFIGRNLDDKYDILIFDNFTNMTTYTSMASGGVAAGNYDEFRDPPPTGQTEGETAWTGLVLHMIGYIRQIGFRTGKDEPATLRGNIEFLEGNNVVSYQGSTPNQVQNFRTFHPDNGDYGGAGEPAFDDAIRLKWVAPRHTGNSGITKFLIGYKVTSSSADFLWFVAPNPTATTVDVEGLVANTEYDFKVVAYNTQGRGQESEVRHFSTNATNNP